MPIKEKKGLLGRLRKDESASLPTNDVMSMQSQGYSKDKIVDDLSEGGFNQQEISEAVGQAEIRQGVEEPEIPELPPVEGGEPEAPFDLAELERMTPEPSRKESLAQPMPSYQSQMESRYPSTPQPISSREITEQIEELAEAIINEKLEEMTSGVGDIALWKDQVQTEILSIKQELLRVSKRFDLLQASLMGKVSEYGQNLSSVSTDIRALEQVFSKIIQPLTTNVKELSKITSELKTKKK